MFFTKISIFLKNFTTRWNIPIEFTRVQYKNLIVRHFQGYLLKTWLFSSNWKPSNWFSRLWSKTSFKTIFKSKIKTIWFEIISITDNFVKRCSPSRRTHTPQTPWDCPVAAGCATRAFDCAWPARRWPSAVAGPVWPSTGTSCATCSWIRPPASRRRAGRTAAAVDASAPWPTAGSSSPGGADACPFAARSRAGRHRQPRPCRWSHRRSLRLWSSPRPVARGQHRCRPPPQPQLQTCAKTCGAVQGVLHHAGGPIGTKETAS